MNIQDFLLRYRKPLFAPNDGAGAGGDGGGGGEGGDGAAAAAAAAGGEGEGGVDAGQGQDTNSGAEGADSLEGADGNDTGEGADGKDGDEDAEGDEPGEFTLKLAEGQEQFQADADAFATDVNKWKAENPNATVDDAFKWAAERQAKLVSEQSAELSQSFEHQVDNWETEAKADKEFGGEKYDENAALAKTAIDTLGTDGLKEVLTTSGLGSHPEVIRFAWKIGGMLKDAPVHKGNGGNPTQNATQRIYPNSAK